MDVHELVCSSKHTHTNIHETHCRYILHSVNSTEDSGTYPERDSHCIDNYVTSQA